MHASRRRTSEKYLPEKIPTDFLRSLTTYTFLMDLLAFLGCKEFIFYQNAALLETSFIMK